MAEPGSVGAKVSIGHSFICDYGRNIHIGNNVTVNTGCTFVACFLGRRSPFRHSSGRKGT